METTAKMKGPPQEDPIDSTLDVTKFAQLIADVAADMQATDIVLIDLQGLVDYTDVFVLCSARNRRQVMAIAESVRMTVKRKMGKQPLGIEGMQQGKWVLLDFGDVVVHVFDETMRGFYDLDGLWADAPRLKGPDSPPSAEPQFF